MVWWVAQGVRHTQARSPEKETPMKKRSTPVVLLTALLLVLAGCSKKEDQTASSNQPAPAAPASAPAAAPAKTEAPRTARSSSAGEVARGAVNIPADAEFDVRTITNLSSSESQPGQTWEGTLESPVIVDGREVIRKGADVSGKVVTAVPSGRLSKRAELSVTLTSVSVRGRRYSIVTSNVSQEEGSKTKRDVLLIGGGAGAGAAIGAVAGGGKGAAIGSAIGAIAGTTGAAATGKRDIKLPPESVLRFRLQQGLRL
jgi:hypothetical protein